MCHGIRIKQPTYAAAFSFSLIVVLMGCSDSNSTIAQPRVVIVVSPEADDGLTSVGLKDASVSVNDSVKRTSTVVFPEKVTAGTVVKDGLKYIEYTATGAGDEVEVSAARSPDDPDLVIVDLQSTIDLELQVEFPPKSKGTTEGVTDKRVLQKGSHALKIRRPYSK